MSWWDRALNNETPVPPPAPTPPVPSQYQNLPTPQVAPSFPAPTEDESMTTALHNEARYQQWVTPSVKNGDVSSCPNCGSDKYFSRTLTPGAVKPRPRCFECGWPVTQGPEG